MLGFAPLGTQPLGTYPVAAATGPYIYRGASTWSGTRYKGTKTDAQLYKGAKTLHP